MFDKILFDDGLPFVLSRALIQKVGLEEALVLQQVHYWLDPKRNQNIFHGKHWVHNTYRQWQKQFSFWNVKKIQRVFNALEAQAFLLNFTKHTRFHKTKYYTINYERLHHMCAISGHSPCSKNGLKEGQIWGDEDENFQEKEGERCGVEPWDKNGVIENLFCGDRMDRMGCTYHPKNDLLYKPITEITNNPPLTPPSNPSPAQGQEEEEKSKWDKKGEFRCNLRQKELFQRMVDAWNALIFSSNAPVSLSASRFQKFRRFVAETSVSELDSWRHYCQKISQSRFLMGENATGFRATLDWALSPDNACKVLEGAIFDKPGAQTGRSLASCADKPWPEYTALLKQHCAERGYSDRWFEACKVLTALLGQATFESWFKRIAPEEKSDGTLYLTVENTFFQDYIKTHFEDALKKAIQSAFPDSPIFEIRAGDCCQQLKPPLLESCVDRQQRPEEAQVMRAPQDDAGAQGSQPWVPFVSTKAGRPE